MRIAKCHTVKTSEFSVVLKSPVRINGNLRMVYDSLVQPLVKLIGVPLCALRTPARPSRSCSACSFEQGKGGGGVSTDRSDPT